MRNTTTRILIALNALLLCPAALAATTNTTLTVDATTSLSGTNLAAHGTATLTGIQTTPPATFDASVSITSITSPTINAPFTITLTNGTITGTLGIPASLLTGTSGSASVTISGGTGSWAGASGSFPQGVSGTASGTIPALTLHFSGSGSITTGGSGGGGGPTAPSITAVLDGASNTADVAQGGIFIVKGSNLCPSISGGVESFGIPRPTVSPEGVKITFTPAAGGAATDAILVYEFNSGGLTQLSGILPSTVATGTYNVTVTNGSASAPFSARVVQQKPTLFTQDTTGTGLATVQDFISQGVVNLNRFTTGTVNGTSVSPAKPGQFIIAYGTGFGPLVGGDNSASPVFDFSTNGATVTAIVGGMTLPVAYAGRAGYAGEDQINVQLPANVPTGCAVPFQISENGILSNPTFIAIADNTSASTCTIPGFTAAQLQKFDQGGTITIGAFGLTQVGITDPSFGTLKSDTLGGSFTQFTGFQLAGAVASTGLTQGCVVTTTSGKSPIVIGTGGTTLDAGTITLTGPAASGLTNVALQKDAGNNYSLNIGTEGISIPGQTNLGTIVAGTYSLKGAGGKDVGQFNASVSLGTPLTVTGGLPASVTRSAGLPLNWTGGNSSDLVEIFGSSSTSATSTTSTSFICITTAGAGSFTVPASILNQLPVSAANAGFLAVFSIVNPTSGNGLFTAPLTAGGNIDSGAFTGLVGTGAATSYK